MSANLSITPMKDLKIFYAALISDMKVTIVCRSEEIFKNQYKFWMMKFATLLSNNGAGTSHSDTEVPALLAWLFEIYLHDDSSKKSLSDDFFFGPKSFKVEIKLPCHKVFRCSFKMTEERIYKNLPLCGIRNDSGVLLCTIEAMGNLRMSSIEGADARALFSKDPFVMLGDSFQPMRSSRNESDKSEK
ncbi:TPA_asm: M [Nitraria betacytorhabdovirus 1]|nr:TPA_asm: M [Nitraria betacytorhabdovirus 1]